MVNTIKIACGLTLAAILLAGCKYNATYTINADDTVSGRIYTALYQDPAEEPVNDSVQNDADTIAASFTTSSITPHNEGSWVGYFVYFNNEPLSTFADPPTTTWDVQIAKSGGKYQVFGYTATDENFTRTSANEDGGYLELDVYFPGSLIEATGASETNVGLGWAHFNLLTQPLNQTPYAKGNGPAAPSEPAPVVTVVIPPGPKPVVTQSATPTTSPSATPSATPFGVSTESDDDSSIPMWVWVVGGALLVTLAGLIGFLAANRKQPTPVPPAPKSKPKAVAVEAEPEADDTEADEPEPEEPEEKTPTPKKK